MKVGGKGLEVFGATDSEANAARERLDLLRGGVSDLILVEGVKLGIGFAFAGGEGEDEVGLAPGDGEFCVWR
ncbi:MAG TPA: hypothetical protein VH117_08960 [Edaphobacter sp.]|nr:hypothetical protein [Edaphobacter sp.]